VWDVLAGTGRRSWICGSMNIAAARGPEVSVLPDPWTTSLQPSPAALAPYFAFVQRQVQEHTSAKGMPARDEALAFGRFMATHGLSLETIRSIATQLLEERRGSGRWKRAAPADRRSC